MSRSPGARIAVLIVQTAEDFKPQRPWNVPETILSGRLFAKNLFSTQAKHFTRTFNKNALENKMAGLWDRTWAIVVPCVKPKHWGRSSTASSRRAMQ
ncbi:MAG: hypothetical protein IT426_13675 [Pirellulales bacterium]|nr:hypothetical protein [Pirellulales bacterium]